MMLYLIGTNLNSLNLVSLWSFVETGPAGPEKMILNIVDNFSLYVLLSTIGERLDPSFENQQKIGPFIQRVMIIIRKNETSWTMGHV